MVDGWSRTAPSGFVLNQDLGMTCLQEILAPAMRLCRNGRINVLDQVRCAQFKGLERSAYPTQTLELQWYDVDLPERADHDSEDLQGDG